MLVWTVLFSSAVVAILLGIAVPKLAGSLYYLLEVLGRPAGTRRPK